MKHHIVNVVLAFGLVSSFTNYFYMNIIGIGFCAIELVLLPLLLANRRRLKRIRRTDVIRYALLLLILLTLSLFFLKPTQISTVGNTMRSYMLFGISFFLFYRNYDIDWERVYNILCIALIADIIGSALLIQFLLESEADKEFNLLINILIAPFVVSYSYFFKSKKHFAGISALALLSAFLSVTRGNIMYVVIAIIFSFFLQHRSTHYFRQIFYIVACGIIMTVIYFQAEEFVKETSPSMHYRLYMKVLQRDDVVTGDDDRKEHFVYLYSNFTYCMIPHGLPTRDSGSVSMKDERLLWSIRDSSLCEMIYTFGIIGYFTPILLISLSIHLYNRRHKANICRVFCVCMLIITAYIFTGYGLLIFPPTVLLLGMECGTSLRLASTLSCKELSY